MQLVSTRSRATRGQLSEFASFKDHVSLRYSSCSPHLSQLIRSLPGSRHARRNVRQADRLQVRATVADPPTKDTASVMSRGAHWQVRYIGLFDLLACSCVSLPSSLFSLSVSLYPRPFFPISFLFFASYTCIADFLAFFQISQFITQIHKFGGTCVASAERIEDVARWLVEENAESKVAVVSAMGSHPSSPIKVTDLLINMVSKAARQDEGFLLDLTALQEKHIAVAKKLLGESKELNEFAARHLDDIADLKAMLHAIAIAGMSTEPFEEFVVGHGELWCAQLMAARCRQLGANVAFMDTRDVLVVTPTSDGNSVDIHYEASNAKLDLWAARHGVPSLVIATGFIAKNPSGQATTLKRNGSDYSATTMGALFKSGHITIWTDVDGVYSADPRKVPEAVCLQHLSYHEAWELSYFGANVLHPRSTLPAMKFKIPISIRNFFNLASPGTVISDGASVPVSADTTGVKGFATVENVSLIEVEGTGMVGVPGTAATIFSTMRDANINVIMISQASSEHSVCFAVKGSDGVKAVEALRKRFSEAVAVGRISCVRSIDDCCMIAVVGQGMASRRGVAATMFDALAKSNINVRAIAQGCSEYNITALIDEKDAVRALRAVHSRFYMRSLPIGVGLIGPGLIGSTFLKQMRDQVSALVNDYHLDIRILGIASSSKMLLSDASIDLNRWKEEFNDNAEPIDLERFASHLSSNYVPNTVIIDCTASEVPGEHYLEWMQKGIHVITPNKKLNSGSLKRYNELKSHQRSSLTHFFYEGTVGAGLPIIATLQHLLASGDRVERIEGIFSGTLSYIFNTYGSGTLKANKDGNTHVPACILPTLLSYRV